VTESQPAEVMTHRPTTRNGADATRADGHRDATDERVDRVDRDGGPREGSSTAHGRRDAAEPIRRLVSGLGRKVRAVNRRYREDQPLPAYAGLAATYTTIVAGLVAVAHGRRAMPTRVSAADIALYSLATHKLTRLLAKDPITSPLRAPFTELREVDGPAELHEDVIGTGWRRATGELLTCPFCLGQWVATAFIFGGMLVPRTTRVVAATFAVHAASDALHFGYAALERHSG
jgi:hypothetical protein